MSDACAENASPPPSPRQVLLGLFILFQLTFLIVSNLLGFVKWVPSRTSDAPAQALNRLAPHFIDEQGHGWQWCNQIETNLNRWVQLTGQDQVWALFAPTVGTTTGFPAVLLSWQDAKEADADGAGTMFAYDAKNGFSWRKQASALHTELIVSDNEPSDINDFIRLGKSRVRRYEGQLWLNPQPYETETAEETAQRMNGRVKELLREYHDPALQYLRWRLKAWQREHPDELAPKQVILLERFYRIHGPEELRGLDDVSVIPMARWLPGRPAKENAYVLDMFDFISKRFQSMTR